ncbi:MAG: hypothetical protein ACTS22_04300 [Phycisphaerales bacterium]
MLRWPSVVLLLWTVLVRCVTMEEPLPGWDADPFLQLNAITGLGPFASGVVDVLIVLSAASIIWLHGAVSAWTLAAGIGCVAVVARWIALDWDHAEASRLTSAWVAAWAAFAAGCVIARDPSLRRFASAVLVGVGGVLLARAALQVFVEHPATVAQFRADPDAALGQRGLAAGSPGALQFERRLLQPDVTAWFGLSNVVASVAVAVTLLLGCSLWDARRRLPWKWLIGGLSALAMLVVLVLATRSKAGPLILIAVVGGLCLARTVSARSGIRGGVIGAWLLVPIAVLPTAGVLIRGAFGAPPGELSLLFRWFYVSTGVEIGAENALAGVGPTGFRQAYMLAKPLHAPESVTSAHHAAVDWLAMLGVSGWPWVLTLVAAAFVLTMVASRTGGSSSKRLRRHGLNGPVRRVVVLVGVAFAMPVIVSALAESRATTIEVALGRIAGLSLAVWLAMLAWRCRPPAWANAAAGLGLVLHAQLDMVMHLGSSAVLALLLVGLGVGGWRGRVRSSVRGQQHLVAPLMLALVAGAIGLWTWRAWIWEQALREGFRAAQRVTWADISASTDPLKRRDMLDDLTANAESAAASLSHAQSQFPTDSRPSGELARLRLHQAEAFRVLGDADASGRASEEAVLAAARMVELEPTSATWAGLGSVLDRVGGASGRTDLLERAAEAWSRSAALDPAGPVPAARAAEAFSVLGDASAASRWARESLVRHDRIAPLDPLTGLGEAVQRRMRALAGVAPPP